MIGSTIKKLKRQYFIFWSIPLLIVIAYETGLLPEGIYAGDGQMEYILETTGILIAIVCVPLALKLFSFRPKEAKDSGDAGNMLKRYLYWSGVRLLILECAVALNLLIYYFLLTNVGALCAIIALTASLFCIPNEIRMRNDLHLSEEE